MNRKRKFNEIYSEDEDNIKKTIKSLLTIMAKN